MKNSKAILRLYNTPLEIGLRSLIILHHLNKEADIEMLMYLDFLCLNTNDIGGPESLHAPIPNRGVQVFSKRDLIQKGLAIMLSKELVGFKATKAGFTYLVTEAGKLFLSHFQTSYYSKLDQRISWVTTEFKNYSTAKIRKYINLNLHIWGGEIVTPYDIELS